MFKLKKFKGWLPVPVLPAAQVAATSYAQQLAYLEWYVDYLASIIGNAQDINDKVTTLTPDVTNEQYPSAKAVQDKLAIIASTLQTLSGAVADIPQIRVNRPLQGGENDLTSLEYNGTLYAVPQGGGTSQTTGTGTLYDAPNSTQRGTFDYIINGKVMIVHIKIPAAFTSSGYGLELRGLPDDTEISGSQRFGYIHNVYGDATVTPLNIGFAQGANYPEINCLNAGTSFATSLSLCDNAVFTVILE